ncbi:hypothetical protein KIW84_034989 [Lathyrus oleraceus]|uniref:Uncharacterized protein n=1 Tax=Pisum sativum TaxID=3888 RepID=A0A9D4Y4V5_PEA|nr:hypothetical protein KIW84_034989 [Pisum sativum]
MTRDHGNHVSTDKQRSKQQVVESDSPPPILKRSRTIVQARKAYTDGVFSEKAKRSSNTGSSSLNKLCGNVAHLLHEDSFQKYIDKKIYKPIDPEYYVNNYVESELKTKFLKLFVDNNLLTLIGLNREYNPDYVKDFYYNVELTAAGTNLSNPKEEQDYEDFAFVLDISKFVYEHMEMSNLRISQIKFGMRLIHLVIVKILARRPGNFSRVGDIDLYLMWCLIYIIKIYRNDWVKFIFDIMIYYRENPKKPIFFSSFVMMILQLNGIECKKEELIESLKILHYGECVKEKLLLGL